MKKVLFSLLLGLLGFLVFNNVQALGMCDQYNVWCEISPLTINTHVVNNYYLPKVYSISGSNENVFCLDPTINIPQKVDRAKDLDINDAEQKALVVIYRMYLAGKVDLYRANIAMRLVFHRTHDKRYFVDDDYVKEQNQNIGNATQYEYAELAKYFETGKDGLLGSTKVSVNLNNHLSDFGNAKDIYCQAIKVAGLATCKNYNNYGDAEIYTANIDFSLVPSSSTVNETSDGHFSQSTVVKLNMSEKGMKLLAKTNDSYIKINSCDVDEISKNLGFKCVLENGTVNNLLTSKEFKIRIENNRSTFRNISNVRVSFNYDYHVPFDVSNLTLLTYHDISIKPQRMLVLNKNRTITAEVTVISVPIDLCSYSIIDGIPHYVYNRRTVSEYDYIVTYGCCNVDYSKLENSSTISYYENNCMTEDIVNLENSCQARSNIIDDNVINKGIVEGDLDKAYCERDTEKISDSVVKQVSMNSLISLANDYENLHGDYTYVTRYYDNEFEAELGISTNPYCAVLTSEEDHIYFPTTATSSSGQYFVFYEHTDECTKTLNPSNNCFRQPNITGNIKVDVHINFEQWQKRYEELVANEKAVCSNRTNPSYLTCTNNGNTNCVYSYELYKADCEAATIQVENHVKLLNSCQSASGKISNWKYNFEPVLTFKYYQLVANQDSDNYIAVPSDDINMKIAKEAVKYWPNTSSQPTYSYYHATSKRYEKTRIVLDGVSKVDRFDYVVDNYVDSKVNLYYQPEKASYILPFSGTIVESQTSSTIGYTGNERWVFDTQLTTYAGAYQTSFTLQELGHNGSNGNIQRLLDDRGYGVFDSYCIYCNEQVMYKRECESCPPGDETFKENYIYRTISLSNVTPNDDRVDTNWTDEKGKAAENLIQSRSGANVISNLDNNEQEVAVKTLSTKATLLASDNIYDDNSKEYLEYDFTLTTRDMQIIRKNTAKSDFNYSKFNTVCSGDQSKNEDASYCFVCNEDGKECISSFVTEFASYTEGRNKWKYYINNKWQVGSMKTIEDFTWNFNSELTELNGYVSGRYPDPAIKEGYLEVYKNWP